MMEFELLCSALAFSANVIVAGGTSTAGDHLSRPQRLTLGWSTNIIPLRTRPLARQASNQPTNKLELIWRRHLHQRTVVVPIDVNLPTFHLADHHHAGSSRFDGIWIVGHLHQSDAITLARNLEHGVLPSVSG